MAKYLIMRLEQGALNYNVVIEKYGKYKAVIDAQLAADGYIVTESGEVVKGDEEGVEV